MTTIMVVDDDPTLVNIMLAVLHDEGYSAVSASDGVEALRNLREVTPDLVLLDIMLPAMDGRDVCRRIRQTPGHETTPVIMTSAAINPDVSDCMADDFLPKPFDLDEMLGMIERLIRSRDARQQ